MLRYNGTAKGLAIVGVIGIASLCVADLVANGRYLRKTSKPNLIELPVNAEAKVNDQISDLVKAVDIVTDSYIQSWQEHNASATIEMLELYKMVMKTEVETALKSTLKTPVEEERFLALKTALENFVREQYSFFMVRKGRPKMSDYEVEDAEYTARNVVALWPSEGQRLLSQMWQRRLSDKIVFFSSVSISKQQQADLKADVKKLAEFVRQEILRRYPNASIEKLETFEKYAIQEANSFIEDPTSPLKKRLNSKDWPANTTTIFESYEGLQKLKPEADEGDLLEIYNFLWNSLLDAGAVIIEPKTSAKTDNSPKINLSEYLRKVRDSKGRADNNFALLNPFLKQKLMEQEVTKWLLKFGLENSPTR